jgi:predicted ribosomally synthesized peptide with nif11-like leader
MSQSEVERFAQDAKSNPTLLAEVTSDNRMEAVVRAATQHGYSFTLDEVKTFVKAKAVAAGRKLSDTQLDQMAGGVANCVGLPQDCGDRRGRS